PWARRLAFTDRSSAETIRLESSNSRAHLPSEPRRAGYNAAKPRSDPGLFYFTRWNFQRRQKRTTSVVTTELPLLKPRQSWLEERLFRAASVMSPEYGL